MNERLPGERLTGHPDTSEALNVLTTIERTIARGELDAARTELGKLKMRLNRIYEQGAPPPLFEEIERRVTTLDLQLNPPGDALYGDET